ncbi:MAG: hypothetical protein P4L28_02550 [Paludibacteraceae bacterium]|nr:hypothetical protein [Paludibacteraceae bacterium]
MKVRLIAFPILILLLFSCGSKKLTDKEQAQAHLEIAQKLFKSNKLNAAKIQIDSINKLFPKEVSVRKKANDIFTQIQLIEQKKNLIYADSLFKIRKVTLDSMTRNFSFEKDEKYEDVGNYIYKSQRAENNTGRTYVKALVEETGTFLLSSIYCGAKPIKHFSTKFSVGDLLAETETVPDGSGYNYTYNDNGNTYENVIYRTDANKSIASFVQQNAKKPILVTLTGKSGKKTYTLSEGEKKAISEAYNLSVVSSDVKKLERVINVSKKKIILYETGLAQN